jgi:hypothetical protein
MILNTISNKSPNDITPILGMISSSQTCMETTNKQTNKGLGIIGKRWGAKLERVKQLDN